MYSISNCRCGELVVQAPQAEIEKLLSEAERSGIKVTRSDIGSAIPIRNEDAPEPLGPAPSCFDDVPRYIPQRRSSLAKHERSSQIVLNNDVDKPEPLGLPVYNESYWRGEPSKPEPQPRSAHVTNDDGRPTPLGLPTYGDDYWRQEVA